MTALERRSSVSLALIFALRMLGLFLVPVFFLLVRSWFQSRSRQHTEAAEVGSAQHD